MLSRLGAEFDMALIGGMAVAYYANPPVTMDIDFLVNGSWVDFLERIEGCFTRPWQYTVMTFDNSPGVPPHTIRLQNQKVIPAVSLDFLFSEQDDYLKGVVARAHWAEMQPGFSAPIIMAEDLIVLKKLAGRGKDKKDVEYLGLKLGSRLDTDYIARTLEHLGYWE